MCRSYEQLVFETMRNFINMALLCQTENMFGRKNICVDKLCRN